MLSNSSAFSVASKFDNVESTTSRRRRRRSRRAEPICGGGNPEDAEKLAGIPIWVFHGDRDRAVAFSKSVEMVDAIREAGGEQIRFTTLEHVGHNSWSSAYALPELYGWMLRHQLGKTAP